MKNAKLTNLFHVYKFHQFVRGEYHNEQRLDLLGFLLQYPKCDYCEYRISRSNPKQYAQEKLKLQIYLKNY